MIQIFLIFQPKSIRSKKLGSWIVWLRTFLRPFKKSKIFINLWIIYTSKVWNDLNSFSFFSKISLNSGKNVIHRSQNHSQITFQFYRVSWILISIESNTSLETISVNFNHFTATVLQKNVLNHYVRLNFLKQRSKV